MASLNRIQFHLHYIRNPSPSANSFQVFYYLKSQFPYWLAYIYTMVCVVVSSSEACGKRRGQIRPDPQPTRSSVQSMRLQTFSADPSFQQDDARRHLSCEGEEEHGLVLIPKPGQPPDKVRMLCLQDNSNKLFERSVVNLLDDESTMLNWNYKGDSISSNWEAKVLRGGAVSLDIQNACSTLFCGRESSKCLRMQGCLYTCKR